jgi:hypothetical protein
MAGFEIPLEGAFVGDARDRYGLAEQQASPLTLDLDADGLDLISVANSTAFFDLDNDGFVERVGWVAPDDALLALDRDANGFIETRAELFGGSPSDGFASLRLLDTSADNTITAADARFAELRVWRDLNGNGVSEANELQSLTAAGIASISLASTHLTTPQTIAGNAVTDTSTFTWTNGTTGLIADVWFTLNQAFSFDARPVEITPEALFLPTLRGYGTISSLTAQMSRDPAAPHPYPLCPAMICRNTSSASLKVSSARAFIAGSAKRSGWKRRRKARRAASTSQTGAVSARCTRRSNPLARAGSASVASARSAAEARLSASRSRASIASSRARSCSTRVSRSAATAAAG